MRYKRIFQLLAFLLTLKTTTFAQNPNSYIFLCFGQSNMEGHAKFEPQDTTAVSRFKVLEAVNCPNLGRNKGQWYPAVPPLAMVELKSDLSGVKPSTERVLIENATAPAGPNLGLPAEGSQLFKVNGKYYLFNIAWPKGGMRTVVIHRADKITGPYEGKVGLQDLGVAQGGLIDDPKGNWYAYLFRDFGAV